MNDFLHIDKHFDKVIYADKRVNGREFDTCTFSHCDFSNSNFGDCIFIDCVFTDCNLSNMKLLNSSLKSVNFKNCKVLGVLFHECADFLFAVTFEDSILDYASFINKKMPKTQFEKCRLREVNFSGTTLTKSIFENCDLDNAIFSDSKLDEVDFRTAINFKIDPERNILRKAKFTTIGLSGLLDKYDIKIVY